MSDRAEIKFDPAVDNEEAVQEMQPYLDELFNLCEKRGIPMVAAFQISNERIYTVLGIGEGVNQHLLAMAQVLYPERFVEVPDDVPPGMN